VHELLTMSACELAQKIRSGEVRSLEVVETHIARVLEVNTELNAMVADRFEDARREATVADEMVRTRKGSDLPPLLGVPFTTKESFRVPGMPNTSGLPARKGLLVNSQAEAVRRLRAAGAILIGVTNVSELCMWMETDNRVYGRTNNPYDVRRTVGGSSGGEGALVGAGAVPFGLAADVGGSIRMPAFFNGAFGHKPTGGLVPNSGQYPGGVDEIARYLTTGPICRRAEDLPTLLRVLAGPDPDDEQSLPYALGNPSEVDLRAVTVYSVRDNGVLPVSRDLMRAQARAARALARRGATVKPLRLTGFKQSLNFWSAMMHLGGGPSFKTLLGQGKPINALAHLLRLPLRRTPHTLPALGLAVVESFLNLMPGRLLNHMKRGLAFRRELVELLGDDALLLFPSYPTPAPRHGKPIVPPIKWMYTAIFNAMELPVTQVPLGLNKRGLPLGVQIAGAHGMDHLTIAAACALEEELGGWIPPEAG
jgi:fatty acid amide hydrolase 2